MWRWYSFLIGRAWWAVVVGLLAAAAYAVAQFGKLGIEFQTQTLLDQKDPEFGEYTRQHETGSWSQSEFAVVCASGEEWISEDGVRKLRELVADLQELPEVGSTMSVLDIPLLRQEPERKPNLFTLAADLKYLRDAEEVNWTTARTEIVEHELAAGTLLSRDGRSTTVLVYLQPQDEAGGDSQARWEKLVGGLRQVRERWKGRLPENLRLAGVPVVYTYIIERVAHDLRVFGVAAAVLFSLGLFAVYRKMRFVFLPLVASVLPVIAILGYMAVAGVRFTVITSNLPLLLFVLALPYTIYLIERYRERREENPLEDNVTSIVESARSLWMPCLFSAMTTMAGFAAFSTSGIVPVKLFGVMMAVGTAVSLVIVFGFFPSSQRPLPALRMKETAALDRRTKWSLAGWFASVTLSRPRAVVALSAVILVTSVAGAFRLTAENKFTSYFWPSSDVYQGLEFIDRQMGGTSTLEIHLTSDQPDFFLSPEGLKAVAAVESYFDNVRETGSVRSLPRLVKEARKSFKPEWFPTMTDKALLQLAQGMVPILFQDILVDLGGGRARGSVQVRLKETAPTLSRRAILDGLQAHLDGLKANELKGLEVETTGIFVLYANMLSSLIDSQRDTLGFVIGAIYLMLLVLFRSFRLALVVLLPQALPAATMLGVMGWCHIPLDLVTVMIAAIALGVGVDSAIQYTMRFREEMGRDGDLREAVKRTHATVGRAIWVATTTIVLGFAVLVTSDFFPSVWFGLFTGLAMLMSQFSALLTLPALFLWLGPRWRLFAPRG